MQKDLMVILHYAEKGIDNAIDVKDDLILLGLKETRISFY